MHDIFTSVDIYFSIMISQSDVFSILDHLGVQAFFTAIFGVNRSLVTRRKLDFCGVKSSSLASRG